MFDGPDIREVKKDADFVNSMDDLEKRTWCSFADVVKNFLGNNRAVNYKGLIEKMMKCYHEIRVDMSIKIHFLDSHLDKFPDNCGDFSDEQGERFHHDLKIMEDRYQGRWNKRIMADYCWSIKWDLSDMQHNRESRKRRFLPWLVFIFFYI